MRLPPDGFPLPSCRDDGRSNPYNGQNPILSGLEVERNCTMLSPECLQELRSVWLVHLTDAALDRLVELLEKDSPLLIHGSFSRAVPMGCLATHAAWHHPRTAHLTVDAGITWLHQVAGLNPATSHVIREWDQHGSRNWEVRAELLTVFREEQKARQQGLGREFHSPACVEV